jgi:Dullard-like phosphatase family protein
MLLHVSAATPSLMSAVAATQRRLASSVAASVLADQISGLHRCHGSSNNNPHQRRPQGGIATAAAAVSTKRWNSTMTRPNLVGQVRSSVRKRRPLVNGEPVAFYMRDLVSDSSLPPFSYSDSTGGTTRSSSSSTSKSESKKRTYESDLVVVLDMDECLIHSKFLSSPAAAQVYAHQLRRQHNHDQVNSASTADNAEDGDSAGSSSTLSKSKIVDSFNVTLPDGDLVHVNVRPGLTDFLEQVTAKYETHIFTAAMEVYAKPVLDQLDPTGTKFAGRWYRESCQSCPEHGAYIKNLRNLEQDVHLGNMNRIVLVDNNPLSFLAQPSNGILVSNFYSDPTDSTLPAVWQLLQELDQCQDVRPILQERFRLKEALAELDAAARVA